MRSGSANSVLESDSTAFAFCSFVPREVEAIIKRVMKERLEKQKYDDAKCKQLALDLCFEIKQEVKSQSALGILHALNAACCTELNIPRYKVVLQSVIGEVKGQGAYIASRCLWDTETDSYASYSMKNVSCFCSAWLALAIAC